MERKNMAKLTAPLLSFEGSGQIARTQVYSTWKGIPYARRYTIPANPRSTSQVQTRSVFSWLNFIWRTAPCRGRRSAIDRPQLVHQAKPAATAHRGKSRRDGVFARRERWHRQHNHNHARRRSVDLRRCGPVSAAVRL